jgi:hypothetical protein
MKKLFLLLVFLGISVYNSKGIDNDCLFPASDSCYIDLNATLYDTTYYENTLITKVYIDTCGFVGVNGMPFDPEKLNMYSNEYEWYFVNERRYYASDVYWITFPEFPFDTTDVDLDSTFYFTIDYIKDEYIDIKQSLQDIENITGEMKFYKSAIINASYEDCSLAETVEFDVSFDNVVNALDIEDSINAINDIKCEFASVFGYYASSSPIKKKPIILYPNPTDDIVTVSFESKIQSLKIVDINGNVIREFSSKELLQINTNHELLLNVSNIQTGLYYVIIDNKYFNKFIIER